MKYLWVSALVLLAFGANSCGSDPATATDHPFEAGGGTVRLAALGDCTGPGAMLAGESNANLVANVGSDGMVSFVHSGAVFNCCMDSVGLEMYSWGGILRVLEKQHCAEPCRCTCSYTVHGEIGDLAPGYYTLEVCGDSLGMDVLCSVQFQVEG
jgi:hypothetical protein